MRICIVGESPSSPTGFGVQAKYLGEAFERWGNEVYYLSATSSTLQEYSKKVCPNDWQVDNIYEPAVLEHNLYRISPQVVLFFRDIRLTLTARFLKNVYQNAPVFFWLAEEGSGFTKQFITQFKVFPQGSLIPLKAQTARMLPNCGRVIPHGLLPAEFYPRDTKELREKWNEKMGWNIAPGERILLNCDRNAFWKCWDTTFDVLSQVQGVRLIAHTKTKVSATSPYNFNEMEELYGVRGRVLYTDTDWQRGFTREEILELYYLSDLRISTSSGEGFGMGAIEAGMAGIPQVVNDFGGAADILKPDSIAPAGGRIIIGNKLWNRPSTENMVRKIQYTLANYAYAKAGAEVNAEAFKKEYDIDEVAHRFLQEFDEARKLPERRRVYRWGLDFGDRDRKNMITILAAAKLGKSIFHLKCWDGKFVERCLSAGMPAKGIEDELAFFPERINGICNSAPLTAPWGKADVLLATDVFDHIHRSYPKEAWELVSRFKDYKCCFIRFGADFRWGYGIADKVGVATYLTSLGLVRRTDLEEQIKASEDLAEFDHEIWAQGATVNGSV